MPVMSTGQSRCTRKRCGTSMRSGIQRAFVEAIEWLAVAAAARGKAVPALRLFGAAAAAREALHLPPRLESDEKRVASGLDQAMRAGGTGAQAALAAGRTLSLERARDEALELARVDTGRHAGRFADGRLSLQFDPGLNDQPKPLHRSSSVFMSRVPFRLRLVSPCQPIRSLRPKSVFWLAMRIVSASHEEASRSCPGK